MTLLEETRCRLRIVSEAFDEGELAPLIEACKQDLRMSGVENIDEEDPLTRQAVCLYCKAFFGYSEESEQFERAYTALKQSMALCSDYNGG